MSWKLSCSHCGAKLKIEQGLLGRRFRCPKCRHTLSAGAPDVVIGEENAASGVSAAQSALDLDLHASSAATGDDWLDDPSLSLPSQTLTAAPLQAPAMVQQPRGYLGLSRNQLLGAIAVGGSALLLLLVAFSALVAWHLLGSNDWIAAGGAGSATTAQEPRVADAKKRDLDIAPQSVRSAEVEPLGARVELAHETLVDDGTASDRAGSSLLDSLEGSEASSNPPASNNQSIADGRAPKAALAHLDHFGTPDDTLEKLKAATVYIKVRTVRGLQTGSGFLIKAPDEGVLVVTNAHVITPEQDAPIDIRCVFRSGTRSELMTNAEVLVKDESTDIAILSVEHADLPDPIGTTDATELRETSPVLVLGFPFGEILTTGNRNPAITVSKGSISSIRRDAYDDVALLQIDGGINPGNSGGPVVTEDGALVGISVAKVRDADIGFAIPRSALMETLLGRVNQVLVREVSHSDFGETHLVNVLLADPARSIDSIHILTFPKDKQSRKEAELDGHWQAASDEFLPWKLEIREAVAFAKIQVRGDYDSVMFQIRWTRTDGKTFYTAPAAVSEGFVDAMASSSRQATESPASPDTTLEDELLRSESIELPDVYSDVDVACGGKYLIFTIDKTKQLAVFDVQKRRVSRMLTTGTSGLCAAGQDKVVFVSPSQRIIQRWDLNSFERELTVALDLDLPPTTVAMGSASQGPVLIGSGEGYSGKCKLYDLRTLKPADIKMEGRPFLASADSEVRASANGDLFTSCSTRNSPSGFFVLKIVNGVATTTYEHRNVGYISPSADGSVLYTAHGVFTSRFEQIGKDVGMNAQNFPVPAIQGGYHLRIERTDRVDRADRGKDPSVSIHIRGHDGAIFTIPSVTLEGGRYSDFLAGKGLAPDRRIFFMPDANALVTLPKVKNRLVVYELDLDLELERSGSDYLFVASAPPTHVAVGEWFKYPMHTKSKRGYLQYKLASGPAGMQISGEGEVRWKPSRNDIGSHDVIVIVSDASGQETFHTFELEVTRS